VVDLREDEDQGPVGLREPADARVDQVQKAGTHQSDHDAPHQNEGSLKPCPSTQP